MRIRGIQNPATACHVSGPILLLAYAMTPLARVLMEAAPLRPDAALLQSLAAVLRALLGTEESGAVDATDVYERLGKAVSIRVHDLGDATSSLSKLLSALRDDAMLAEVVEKAFFSGACASLLTGERVENGMLFRRTKRTKTVILPVPFHVSLHASSTTTDDTVSLQQLLSKNMSARPLNGYNWSGNYEETTVPIHELSVDGGPFVTTDSWQTRKQLELLGVPPIWLIHVDRFSSVQGRIMSHRQICDIPLVLDTEKDVGLTGDSQLYRLSGAVLHVADDTDSDEEEAGHYVTLVRTPHAEDESSIWTLVDDSQTTRVSQDTALKLLAGSESNLSENGTYMQATLLVYESPTLSETMDIFENKILEQVAEAKKLGESLIGRRLQVLWSKGKYYAGEVAAFDPQTGKHTIRYDDGDIRTYNLSKKTFQWI